MHFGEGVVKTLPVSKRFVQGRVESIAEAELELVSALEEVPQLGKRDRDARCLPLRVRLKEFTLHPGIAGEEPLL